MEWFTADSHFFHKNILGFENRPFDNVEEMNKGLIKKWNETVKEDDTVYHLGDFGMHLKYDVWVELLQQLNGKIILIQGNHDNTKELKKLEEEGLIEYHAIGLKIKKSKHVFYLTHYPFEIGERPQKWSLHGHIHSSPSMFLNQLNVGVDSIFSKQLNKEFGELISFDEIIEYAENLTPQIIENYGR